MSFLTGLAGLALNLLMLVDGFETMLLPRRVTHRFRFARVYYRSAWRLWRALAGRIPGKRRDAALSWFGPLSLLVLLATWVNGLIFGFALLLWAVAGDPHMPEAAAGFGTYWYWSGTTFFTLGYGDVTPATAVGRFLSVAESGIGFGFLAMIIGYLPVLYQAFSRREINISLLDARAGSPPSAAQLWLRSAQARRLAAVDPYLAEWERWAAELLESHLSFPVLTFYRSQHDNQSWLAAVTVVLDACALHLALIKGNDPYQAQLTFAMARHAVVDIALVLKAAPAHPKPDRLDAEQFQRFRQELQAAGLDLRDGADVEARLTELRRMYEPFVEGIARLLLLTLPPIVPAAVAADNWQRSAWMRPTPGIGSLPLLHPDEEHFS